MQCQNTTEFQVVKGQGYLEGSIAPNFDQPGAGNQYHVPDLESLRLVGQSWTCQKFYEN